MAEENKTEDLIKYLQHIALLLDANEFEDEEDKQHALENAMEEINNNPHLSEAQKKQMRSMMGGATAAMESARNAPEADKQAVRPHMNELRSVTGDDRSR